MVRCSLPASGRLGSSMRFPDQNGIVSLIIPSKSEESAAVRQLNVLGTASVTAWKSRAGCCICVVQIRLCVALNYFGLGEWSAGSRW